MAATGASRKPRVAVIGAGVTGALTALTLAEDGYDVFVFEKRVKGNGASSRSAAAIRQQFSTSTTVRGMRYATQYYASFGARYGASEQLHFQRGYLFLYRTRQEFTRATANAAMQRSCGLNEVEVLAPDDVRRRFPYVGSDGICGATWCPTDGFLTPDLIYETAFAVLNRLGGKLHQHTEVIGAVKSGSRITALRTTTGDFPAELVINATGIWTPRTVSEVLQSGALDIDPKKVFLHFLRVHDKVDVRMWPFIATEVGAYCRPDNGPNPDALMIGWLSEQPSVYIFSDEFQDEIPQGFGTDADGAGGRVWRELASWLPPLANMRGIRAVTSGMYDMTPDHNPFIDYDQEVPNLIHAVGFSGHGVMHAPFTAAIVRHLVHTGHSSPSMTLDGVKINLSCFAIGRRYEQGEGMVL